MADKNVEPMTVEDWLNVGYCFTVAEGERVKKALQRGERLAKAIREGCQPYNVLFLYDNHYRLEATATGWLICAWHGQSWWSPMENKRYPELIDAIEAADAMEAEKEKTMMTADELKQWGHNVTLTKPLFDGVVKALQRGERLAELFEQETTHRISEHYCIEFDHSGDRWKVWFRKRIGSPWERATDEVFTAAIDAMEAADKLEAEKEKP
jgi:hypothetical protein